MNYSFNNTCFSQLTFCNILLPLLLRNPEYHESKSMIFSLCGIFIESAGSFGFFLRNSRDATLCEAGRQSSVKSSCCDAVSLCAAETGCPASECVLCGEAGH